MSWIEILRRERDATPDSFYYQLQVNGHWDREAFARLFEAMKECSRDLSGQEDLPRWIAFVFWELDRLCFHNELVGDGAPPDYISNARVNLNHLAFDLFSDDARAFDRFEPI